MNKLKDIFGSIQARIFIPLLLLTCIISAYSYFVWLPSNIHYSLEQARQQNSKTLSTLSEGLVPLLLSKNLSNVYDNIDLVLKENQPEWLSINLHDQQGNMLYPLFEEPITRNEHTLVIEQPVMASEQIGKLTLTYDFTRTVGSINQSGMKLFLSILAAIIAFSLIQGWLAHRLIIKPVSRLASASNAMAQGNYDVELPALQKGEIATLVESFRQMREQIYTQNTNLEQEVSMKQEAEQKLSHYIEDLQQAQLDAMMAQQTAEKANVAKGEFLANMSHELRTPMNGIIGMTELLMDAPRSQEERTMLQAMHNSGENLLSLLNDILDISKVEAGDLIIEDVPFDLEIAAREIIQLYNPLANEKNLELILKTDENIPTCILSDLSRFQQIVRNLISNALKFTEEGSVTISLYMKEDTDLMHKLHVSVTDTGIGIPEEKLPHIFEKFTQADSSTSRKYGGTGLGLAITKQLVELLWGSIKVESTFGQGTTFTCIFPVTIPEDGARPVNILSEIPAHMHNNNAFDTQASLLVVDNHPINTIFVEKLLTKMGFTNIDYAENGVEALEKWQLKTYDIIFMDCQMPELDGYETTTAIRQSEGDNHQIIIAMTANAMLGDKEKCLKAGMDDYISKPIKADKLTKTLVQWIPADPNQQPAADEINPITHQETVTGNSANTTTCPVNPEQFGILFDAEGGESNNELITLFLEQCEHDLATIEASLFTSQSTQWKKAAHKMKGSSANIGAENLSSLCRQAEDQFEAEDAEKQELLNDIIAAYSDLESFLLQYMHNPAMLKAAC